MFTLPASTPVERHTLPADIALRGLAEQGRPKMRLPFWQVHQVSLGSTTLNATQESDPTMGPQRFHTGDPARVVVLVSGSGSLLQALLDALGDAFPVRIVAVGADRADIEGLERARSASVPTFVRKLRDYPSRADWDRALTEACVDYAPDLVVSAGFLKLVGDAFLERFGGRYLNSHPALLPAFPGMHGVREALDYGVRVTGCTLFVVDSGVDTGPILAQEAVSVLPEDDETSLHERIKAVERRLLVNTLEQLALHGWTVQGRKVSIP